MKRSAALFLWASSMLGGDVMAETQKTLAFLSSEPASLLDLGMHRLEMQMNDLARNPGMHFSFGTEAEVPSVSSSFDAKTGHILIQANYDFTKPRSIDDRKLQTQLEDKIRLIKFSLGIDPESGTPLMEASALLPAFSHQDAAGNFELGEELDASSKQIGSDLDALTEVAARVGIRMLCRSKLKSAAITCERR